MSSKVNVSEIVSKHKSTLQGGNGKLLKLDRKYFITYPIILGLILSFLIRIPNDGLVNIFAICLSIFIGLFLNLLVLIISFAENKLNIKDKSNRAILLEHTFYNITYTIVASLVGLGFLFLSNIDFFPTNWKVNLSFIDRIIDLKTCELTINAIVQFVLYFVFYSIFIHIIMTLLMIVKRIFSLFKAEIEEINKVDKKQ
jgi:hypothetical protein